MRLVKFSFHASCKLGTNILFWIMSDGIDEYAWLSQKLLAQSDGKHASRGDHACS
jgi:hypothetical protein